MILMLSHCIDNIWLGTAEFKKGCAGPDGTNQMGIHFDVENDEVKKYLNTACREEEESTLVTCACDDQDLCNNANAYVSRVCILIIMTIIGFEIFI